MSVALSLFMFLYATVRSLAKGRLDKEMKASEGNRNPWLQWSLGDLLSWSRLRKDTVRKLGERLEDTVLSRQCVDLITK